MQSFVGCIFHYKDIFEKSNGHYCVVIAEDLEKKTLIAVRITSKLRRLPRTQNAVFILPLEDVFRIFPRSLYGQGIKDWHKESKIFFAHTIERNISDISFKPNKCPEDILRNIIDTIKNAYPYVLRTEFMRYFIKPNKA